MMEWKQRYNEAHYSKTLKKNDRKKLYICTAQ
jgi:hypothetical protein